MDKDLQNILEIYGLGKAIKWIFELESSDEQGFMMIIKQRNVLEYLISSVRKMVDGRNEEFVNNVRTLEDVKFFTHAEAKIAIDIFHSPESQGSRKDLMVVVKAISANLPNYKNNCTC